MLAPRAVAAAWLENSQVGIVGSCHPNVEALIEKDFRRLYKPAERDPDAIRILWLRAGRCLEPDS